ncbi:MAG: FecR domain-containing protein [Planctomycetota bacterium]
MSSDAIPARNTDGPDLKATLRRLAAAACERPLGPAEVEELEMLLSGDLLASQYYLGYTQVHSSLLQSREQVTPECIWERVERDLFAKRRTSRPITGRKKTFIAAAATAGVLLTLVTVLATVSLPRPPIVGRVVAIAERSTWGGDPSELGAVVRAGGTLSLEDGFVTVRLKNGVTVDVIGDTEAVFESELDVALRSGLLAADVGLNGRGFTVGTEDADVVDLGTRFLVGKNFSSGTHVRVDEGLVEAWLKDEDGSIRSVVELIAGQSGRLDRSAGVDTQGESLFDFDTAYAPVAKAKGDVRRFSGAARPFWSALVGLDLRPFETLTKGRVFIVPEAKGVVLADGLVVSGRDGVTEVAAGTAVDSYLCHYDIGDGTRLEAAGQGGISLGTDIVAVIDTSADLAATDALFANPGTRFTDEPFRGLDDSGDEITLSADGSTVVFDLEAQPGRPLDQFRVLVRSAGF